MYSRSWQITQYDTLAMLYADQASWYDVAHYPSLTLCRRIVRLADYAAVSPECWRASLRRWECQGSIAEIARLLGTLPRLAAQRAVSVDLTLEEDRDCVDYYGAVPEWLVAPRVSYDDATVSRTYLNARALADFAARSPKRYRAIRLAIIDQLSQDRIAELIDMTQRQVSTYLEDIPQLRPLTPQQLNQQYFGG